MEPVLPKPTLMRQLPNGVWFLPPPATAGFDPVQVREAAGQLVVPDGVMVIAGTLPPAGVDGLVLRATELRLATVDPPGWTSVMDLLESVHDVPDRPRTLALFLYGAESASARMYAISLSVHIRQMLINGESGPRGGVVSLGGEYGLLGWLIGRRPVQWWAVKGKGVASPPLDSLEAAVHQAARDEWPAFDLARELRARVGGSVTPFGVGNAELAGLAAMEFFMDDGYLRTPAYTREAPRVVPGAPIGGGAEGSRVRVPVQHGPDAARQFYEARRWLRLGIVREAPTEDVPSVEVHLPPGVRGGVLRLPASDAGAALDVLVLTPLTDPSGRPDLDLWLNLYRNDRISGVLMDAAVVAQLHNAVPLDAGHRILVEERLNRVPVGRHKPGSVIQSADGRWLTAQEYATALPETGPDARIVVLWHRDRGRGNKFIAELAKHAIVVTPVHTTERGRLHTRWESIFDEAGSMRTFRADNLNEILIYLTGGHRAGTWEGTDLAAVTTTAELQSGRVQPPAGIAAAVRRVFETASMPASDAERWLSVPIPRGAETESGICSWLESQDVVVVEGEHEGYVRISVPGRYVRDVVVRRSADDSSIYQLLDVVALTGSGRARPRARHIGSHHWRLTPGRRGRSSVAPPPAYTDGDLAEDTTHGE
ncbi:hypothetical protein [Dactylosporangium darangshiense]|uniref:Uncharacterized protein n=1 Tax=Dactylosporangium darangshiense TaxID=579108 RepID=A0ABP8DVC4_9ACTN